MTRTSRVALISIGVCATAALGTAHGQRTVRWEEGSPGSKQVAEHGVVSKRLDVDGLTIVASLADRTHGLAVELQIANRSGVDIDVRPELVELHGLRPRRTRIPQISALALGDKVRKAARSQAAAIQARGFAAMTTRHEQVPIIETVPNPAAAADPSQPPTIVTTRTETVVTTVPDEAERTRAQGEASTITLRADADARRIVERAVATGRLSHNARVAGSVYFERDREVRTVLLRIHLGGSVVEFPFTATERRPLVGPRTLVFR